MNGGRIVDCKQMTSEELLKKIHEEVEEERRNYKGPHCCMTMHYGLLSDKKVLNYVPKYREYSVNIPNSPTCMAMDYCMFCGKKLPESLRIEWFDILEQKYGLESPYEEDRDRIPKEFLTDEWWKKRGL